MRRLICSVLVLAILAGSLWAFDVEATIKKVDAEQGVVVFFAKGQDRTARLAKAAKIVDAGGKDIAAGLKEIKPGAVVTLSIEREDNRPVIHAIRLGKPAPAAKAAATEFKLPDTAALTPLTDLGTARYQGFAGGLYPDGKNERPADHEAAGRARAAKVQPRDADGKPSTTGKIVLLGVGFSNTVQAFSGFLKVAKEDKDINPHVVLVNGAVGGMSANMIQNANEGRGAKYWATVDERLKEAGVTRAQVQAIWLKETNPGPHSGAFPGYIQELQGELANIVRLLPQRFPNLQLVYLSSRTYAGWARPFGGRAAPGNSEPWSYETGFAVKWLIEQQLKGDAVLNYDSARGEVLAPWLSWGPYLWANGAQQRGDGFSFERTDFRADDQMHHSEAGMRKLGEVLRRFFHSDTTTRGWFNQP
jgi:hypothetical protein